MSKRIRAITAKSKIIYDKYGVKGLIAATISKFKYSFFPIFYRNRFLMRLLHPKIQTVFLELTNKCNLHCKMCNWQSRDTIGFISKSLFKSCIDQFISIFIPINLKYTGNYICNRIFISHF